MAATRRKGRKVQLCVRSPAAVSLQYDHVSGVEDVMPYLKIQTSKPMDAKASETFLKKASRLVAKELSKPEDYVMVVLEPSSAMVFAGNAAPAAFVDLRAIGLPAKKTGDLSRVLCDLIESELGVAKDRVFINFADVSPNLWGWNGETF
jgi:phenylpyruvate tautomerase